MGNVRAWSWVAFGGGLAAVVGAFLPWARVLVFTVNGTDGDGQLTLAAGVVAAAVAAPVALGHANKLAHIATVLCGVGVLFVGIYDLTNLRDFDDEAADDLFSVEVTPGAGLYLTVAAGATMTIAGLAAAVAREDRTASAWAPSPPYGAGSAVPGGWQPAPPAPPVDPHGYRFRPGWYQDPYAVATWRWWDGERWTADTHP
jgi:hypothetical protein